MASSAISKLTATEQAQFFYVTYYGRPADPAGLKYWADVISKNGLDSVAKDFSNSAEAKVKYPSLGTTSNLTQLKTDIQTLYKTVFGRDPLATDPATGKPYDAAGLDYWYDGVAKGNFSFGQLSIILYNAAAENPITQQDVLAIGNRATAAQSFTDSLKTPAQIAAYSGQTAVTSTATWLATVDYRAETVTNAVASKSDLIFNLVINPEKPNTANPVITVTAVTVNEDSKDNSGKVTATDADGDKLTYSVDAASAKGGTVAIDATGAFKYSPAADFAGSDSFKVSVSDGKGGVSVATVNVTVNEVNAVKTTAALAATEDSVASGKIAFDNPGAETLVATVKTQGTNGKVAFVSGSADGSFTYTPNENYNGSDVFVIEVKDGTKVSTQTVTVTVAAVNDKPAIAMAAETISATEDVAFTTGKVGATDADTKDASPDVITYTASGASKGTVSFTAAGDYTYTPKANANGEDSFVITATDKAGATATKTVAVNIAAVNDAPTAAATVALSTDEDTTVRGAMGAIDVDTTDTLSYAVKTQGTKGAVALAADGSYVYTPNKDANGSDSFVLTVTDGKETATQTVNVSIAAKNDAPVLAATATAMVVEDNTLSAAVAATDPDTGDTLSYAIKTAPGKGTATISAAGVVSYTPTLNYAGADSLVVEVTDTAGAKSTQTLSITVTPDNDRPVAASGTASVVGGAAVTIPLADLISDIETAKDKLQIVDVIASRGNVSVSGTNLVYTAQAGGANTTDTVYFTVQDEGGAKSTAASISVSIVTRTGGTSGNDVLGGSTAAEEIAGLAGDDFINGGGGYDLITAGTGNDTVVFSTQAAQILGGAGTDTLKLPTVGDLRFDLTSTTNQYAGLTKNSSPASGGETVTVLGFEDIDASAAQVSVTLKGAVSGSALTGGDLNDSIVGGTGNDSLSGGLDNDILVGGGGVDTVRGGEGSDQITAAGMLYGDKGADTIVLDGAATVYGGDDNDRITHSSADSITQVIYGDGGNDVIILSAKLATVDGGSGADSILVLSTNAGADTLSIMGGTGADTIRLEGWKDYVDGGEDNDLIYLNTNTADSSVTVIGGTGADTLSISADSIIEASDLRNVSQVEVIDFSVGANGQVTINGDSQSGLVSLTQVNLDGSDSIYIKNLTQKITVDVININDATGTYVWADSTTGSIVVRADSIGADDTVIAAGADDFFADTIQSGASYVFTNAGGIEFIELTGSKTAYTAAVSIVSGQAVSLTSVTGDSVTLSVALVGGGTGAADTVTVTGGSLGDTVNLAGAEKATVYGGSGNDSIDASGAGTTSLYGDNGVDTIVVGAFDSVWGGSGDDLIILASGADSTTYIDGGDGNDAVRVSGGGSITSTLVSVEYLDLTSATANALDVAVTLKGSSFGQVSVDGDTLSVTNTIAGLGAATIVLSNGTGSGDTAVRITADSLSDVVIIANTGIDSSDVISVDAGVADTDVITGTLARASSGVSYDLTNVTGIDSLTLSRAKDTGATVTTVTSARDTVRTGADSVIVSLISTTADSIALNLTSGTGSVTVTSGDMADTIDVQAARRGTTITTNSGADSVNSQNADSVSDLLDLGSGNDTAYISGKDTVSAGAGDDWVYGNASGDSLVVDAGTGKDTISVDGANDSVVAGDDADLIVLTGTSIATATVIGGMGIDTVRLAGAVVSSADSIFTNISAEVLNLAADTAASQNIALGSIAAANGFETIYIGAGDSVSLTSQDTIAIVLPVGSSSAMRVTADSLTAVSLRADSVADAFGSEDTISLSAANTADVLVISGNATATYNLTNVTGLDSIHASTTAGAPRTLTITGIGSDSVTSTSVTSADTGTTLDITIASRDAVTFTVTGNSGNDRIVDTLGGTVIANLGRGADSVWTGAGSDNINVSSSVAADSADVNYVSGGGGNDTITSDVGNDVIVIGNANAAASLPGASWVSAGAGNDSVQVLGQSGSDSIYLGSGNDTVSSTADTAGSYIELGTGFDSILTNNGDDTIIVSISDAADTRADIVSSGSGRDSIVLGSGADTIDAGAGNDTVYAGGGHDTIVAGTGNDWIDAGSGNDTVDLSADTAGGFNTVFGGAGADSVLGGASADYIDLSGNDAADSNIAFGGDSTDTLIGGNLNDSLIGGSGNDSIVAAGGNDSVNAGPGSDYVSLGDGDDTFVVDSSADFEVTDSVTSLKSYDSVYGGAGRDTILLKGTDDLSLSYAALQFVYDIESFQLEGNLKKSTVVVSNDLFNQSLSLSFSGSNSIEVNDTNVTETGTVSIELGSAVSAATVFAAANLAESISAVAGDSLDDGDLYFRGQMADEVYFREFTVNPNTAEFNMTNVSAGKITLGADTGGYVIDLDNGFNGVDVVVAITGADSLADSTRVYWNSDGAASVGVTIVTRSTADSIVTGADNDSISSGSGHDTISTGSGLDTVDAGAGNDLVSFASDTLGYDYVNLGAGNDTLEVTGSAVRVGAYVTVGGGADSVNLAASSGSDVIALIAADTAGDWISAGAGNDSIDLSLSSGADTVLLGTGRDSVWTGGGNDSVVLDGDTAGTDYVYLGSGDDTVSSTADTSATYVSLGTGADRVVFGGNAADTVVNDAGDTAGDYVSAGSGADLIDLSVGTGHDTVLAGAGNDTISLGAGRDTVTPGTGLDIIDLGADTVTDIVIIADTLLSGGNESFVGRVDVISNFVKGTDAVNFAHELSLTSATTFIADSQAGATGSEPMFDSLGMLTISLTPNVGLNGAIGEIEAFSRSSNAISSGSGLTQGEAFAFEYGGSTYVAVAKGTDSIGSVVQISGVTGVTSLAQVWSEAIGDSISASAAATLVLGAGPDTLIASGNNVMTVTDRGGANYISLVASTAGNSITLGAGADTVLAGFGADTVSLGSGSDWIQFGAAESLSGSDKIDGGAGNDTLYFAAAVDLSGGESADSKFGGLTSIEAISLFNGTNKFILGDSQNATGIVSIFGGTGADSIQIAASSVRGALAVQLGSGDDTIALTGAANLADSVFTLVRGVEVLDLATGQHNAVTLGSAALTAGIVLIDGSSGNDSINASAYNVATTVIAGAGNDVITLGSAGDVIRFDGDALTNADTIALGGGNDTIQLQTADTISGELQFVTGAEVLVLASGSNIIDLRSYGASAGILTVVGGGGADSVNASNYADTLSLYVVPGAGSDSVYLGSGNDSIVFGADSLGSSDLVSGGAGRDVLQILGADTVLSADFANVSGIEVLQLGSGSNVIELAQAASISSVFGNTGADSINASAANIGVYISGDSSNDWIYTANSADTIDAGVGNDWVFAGSGADTVYGRSGADSVDGGNGADYLDLGTGADTAYLGTSLSGGAGMWSADTLGDGAADLVIFDLTDIGTADSFSDVVFNFTVGLGGDSIGGFGGYNLADSVSQWVEGGFLLNGSGADTAFSSLDAAVTWIQANDGDNAKYDLDANEVFLFRVGTDSYVGTTDGTKVTSVVKLVGIAPASASFDLKESPTTDGIFYIGPNGG